MSELKFGCSSCGQHIACDDGWAGTRIQCPTCQAEVTVPSPPPAPPPIASRPRLAVQPAVKPMAPLAAPRGIPAAREKTCGLAIASLVCSLVGLGCGALGCIPGIVCGHIARARMRSDPSLKGQGMAVAGLIIGYFMATVFIAAVAVVLYFHPTPEDIAKWRGRMAAAGEIPAGPGRIQRTYAEHRATQAQKRTVGLQWPRSGVPTAPDANNPSSPGFASQDKPAAES